MSRPLCLVVLAACAHGPAPSSPRGAWDAVQAIESHATVTLAGMTGTADMIEDVATGRNAATMTVGPYQEAEGWDGTHAWQRAAGGEVVTLDAPEAIALARTNAWLSRRGYLRDTGARYRELGTQGGLHGREATPEGGAPVALWFDARGRLVRTVGRSGTDTVITTYADYRHVGGVELPFHVTIVQGDARNTVDMHVTAAKLVATPAATAFTAPSTDTERLTFAPGVTRTTLPFELINNHIYAHASVDGQPVRVLVDTGGLNLLTPAAAKRLGLTVQGAMAGTGVGDRKVDVGVAHAKQLVVGDVTLADPVIFVLDLEQLPDVEGEQIDGLVGFELFSRVRVRIDYPQRRLELIAPAAFTPPAGAIAVPFEMSERTPIVQGSIDGIAGRMQVDTGSRSSITPMAKFTRDHDLVVKYKPPFETITGWGIGGPQRGFPVRFHEVKIGSAVVRDVIGDLFTGDKGALSDPDTAANLGGGILRRFVVTFDYAAKIMYLEPAREPEAKESYDKAGIFVIRDGDALRVIDVVPKAPAALAGIRASDRLTAIDGTPISARPLAAWRALLRDSAAGTKLRVHDERAGDVTLTLAELVP